MEQYFNIKCRCGMNELMGENSIKWNEDESCSCHKCGSSLRHKANANSYGWGFAEDTNKIMIDGCCDE